MSCLFFSFKVISLAPRALDLAALAIRIALAGNLTRFYGFFFGESEFY